MKSDFKRTIYVQVLDRDGNEPMFLLCPGVEELNEDAEDNYVGVYKLESVKRLVVDRKLY